MAQMCRGGSVNLAKALVSDIREHGGENFETGTALKAILVREGRATGVELDSGERILARAFVASGSTLSRPFLDLIDADSVPRQVRERRRVSHITLLGASVALNVALDETAALRRSQATPGINQAFMVILGFLDVRPNV